MWATRAFEPDSGQGFIILCGCFCANLFTDAAGRVEFGLGLGLQIVKDIVVRHNGSITVESEPGRTCFRVVLPSATNGEIE